MGFSSENIAPVRFSTDDFPERDRKAVWIEEFARSLFKFDYRIPSDAPFYAATTFWRLSGLTMIVGQSSAGVAIRSQSHIAESANDSAFHIQLGGKARFEQLDAELSVGREEAILLSGEDTFEVDNPDAFRHISLILPRSALLDRMPRGEDAFMKRVPGHNQALQLLTGYLSLFDSVELQPGPSSAGLETVFASHVCDLCALALNSTRDAGARARAGVSAARLHAIKQDALAHLSRCDLSPVEVARRYSITPRYLHKLFEPEGITFSEFVVSARLDRARLMLADPAFEGRTIASIGYSVGFADLSHFNRCFRRRFGMTPSDARAEACSGEAATCGSKKRGARL